MPERALVRQPGPRQGGDRGMAARVQRGTAEEIAGWADALDLRQATGRKIGYINPRTLKQSATEKRGDVGPRPRPRRVRV